MHGERSLTVGQADACGTSHGELYARETFVGCKPSPRLPGLRSTKIPDACGVPAVVGRCRCVAGRNGQLLVSAAEKGLRSALRLSEDWPGWEVLLVSCEKVASVCSLCQEAGGS